MRDDDGISNTSGNETFEEIIQTRVSRRGFLGGSAAVATAASLGGVGSLLKAVPAQARPPVPVLGFAGVSALPADGVNDIVRVPEGYDVDVLIAWGDPIGIDKNGGPAFKSDASNTAAEQARQWGMHNDGIVYFPIKGSRHGLIVQNSEYADEVLLFKDGLANWNAEKSTKLLNAHGVNVIEVRRTGRDDDDDDRDRDWHRRFFRHGEKQAKWRVVRPSKYARRITGETRMRIAGPAAGHDLLKTGDDPTGREVLGTLNNCAMGFTPWGTYLACEENFNGYFNRTVADRSDMERRYGIAPFGPAGANLHTTHPRFNADAPAYRNEPNRFGWVVEFDPFNPDSTPVKRTALGRMKHEGAWVQEAKDGRVVVYMGDDEANEYVYRYVSNLPWKTALKKGISPLDDGILYVAKFKADGTGEWLPLTESNPALAGKSLSEILIYARAAGDAVGATMMDRPEWIDTFPDSLTAIGTFTNNSRRGTNPPSVNAPDGSTTAGSARPPVDKANPRGSAVSPTGNPYGHILTWSYKTDFTGPTFSWDIYALCGNPEALNPDGTTVDGNTLNGDKFGSPDGIYVAPSGRLWIQTDVSGSTINTGAYSGFGNNQMLCSDPVSREVRRFLTGPNVCEITGVFVTPDETTMFVGIQHPGEAPSGNNDASNPTQYSSWPNNQFPNVTGGRPRSSLVVITKKDGGVIGS